MSGLVASNLTFRYSTNSEPVIQNFSLTLSKGSITLLTGVSGCGKSTLCSILAGIYPQHGGTLTHGYVTCNGVDVHQADITQRSKLIGMMFQNPDLQFCMDTVESELVFCLENICTPRNKILIQVQQALSFCEIEHLRTRRLHTLSGGEKQKVMLACIAALQSEYIILDEPVANIDPDAANSLAQKLHQFCQQKGTTILVVDHAVQNFLPIADEMIVLGTNGSILQRGLSRHNIASHTSALASLGISVPGAEYSFPPRTIASHKQSPVLSLQSTSVAYPPKTILDQASAPFYQGCVTAITGKSGSGKSTVLKALSRMIPYEGRIYLEQQNIAKIARKHYARQVGIAFQNPQDQFVANTVYEEIALSLRGKLSADEIDAKTQTHLEELGLWKYRNLSPYMLSQGQQRRLAVGALLAYQCKVLLCDEPTYGQDKHSTEAIMALLLHRVTHYGLTVILSTHDEELAETYSDYRYICKNGKLYHKSKAGG